MGRRWKSPWPGALLAAGLACAGPPAHAGVCLDLAARAETLFAIPRGMLQAVVLTESGDRPYALNIGGAAYFPDRAGAAMALIRAGLARRINVDVGCGQIAVRLHPHYFAADPERALNPWFNIVYASKLLLDNRKQYGTWTLAVAHYHSGSPERQAQYVCRVARNLVRLSGAGQGLAPAVCRGQGLTMGPGPMTGGDDDS